MSSLHRLYLASQTLPEHCVWCWMADLLPPSWPHHVTPSLPPSLGNGPAGCWGVGPAPGALWECRLRAVSLGCQRGLSLRLNNLLDWGLRSKELLGALQENASSVVSIDSLSFTFYRPLLSKYSCIYRYIIVHEMHFGMLPRLEYLLVSK